MPKPSVLVSRRWPEAVEARIAENFNAEFNRADRPLTPDEFREAIAKYLQAENEISIVVR